MNHKPQAKSSVNILIATILLTSLIFIINTGSAVETTEIGMILSSETVSVGEEFTVTVYINPTEAIGGWEIYYLNFSKDKVQASEPVPGSEWTEYFDVGNVENVNGTIKEIQCWKNKSYPDYNHTACEISFTALESGVCTFEITTVDISNASFVNIPVTTLSATITITGDDGGNGGNGDNGDNGGNGTPPNTPPVANASASETSGFVGMYISFNGSLSYDPDEDGSIESWEWDFGDGETGEGETTVHLYFEAGIFNVTLTVTDNKGATGTDIINVTIIKGPNIPPEKPTITGPEFGHKDIVYEYTANSTDVDNDTISYIFDWGDGDTTTTDFLPKGVMITQNHSWSSAGRYTITVQATDNQTYSQTAELIVMIDAINIGDIGYFTDDDGDEIYDIFHNETGEMTELGQNDTGSYLIDSDGDGEWDFVYNSETDELEDYIKPDDKKPAPFLEIIVVIIVIIFLIILILIFLKKKQNPKKPF